VTHADPPVASTTEFRRVFGHLPTGVVVVTGVSTTGDHVGITIGSFSSISLEPPLAGFFIGRQSRSWPLIAETGKFCANVLATSQSDWCWRFAKDAVDGSRFDGIAVQQSHNGSPVLPGVVATVDCTVHQTHIFGDHDLVVGAVTDVQVRNDVAAAMVFFKGKTGEARIAE